MTRCYDIIAPTMKSNFRMHPKIRQFSIVLGTILLIGVGFILLSGRTKNIFSLNNLEVSPSVTAIGGGQSTTQMTTSAVSSLSPEILPTETPPPLRFTFPTPRAAPVSAWRPPLYPIPWAPTPNDHFYFVRPIAADEINWPDGNYRYGGVFFEDVTHSGVDIPAKEDTPVLAAGSGKVIWAGYGLYSGPESPDDPYGNAVVIRHDFGFNNQYLFTLYAHLSRVDVVRGQNLETGEKLGLVGDTGFTTGPHLHFEVRLGDNFLFATLNPELWMAPPQGWGVLVARIMGTGGQKLFHFPVLVHSMDTGRTWEVITYGSDIEVNSDPYYRENLVIGDLPAGNYQIEIAYVGKILKWDTQIQPGRVNYFTFRGRNGFFSGPPPTPEIKFTPPIP